MHFRDLEEFSRYRSYAQLISSGPNLVSRRAINDELYIFMRYFLRITRVRRATRGVTVFTIIPKRSKNRRTEQRVLIGHSTEHGGGEFFRRILRNETAVTRARPPEECLAALSKCPPKFLFHRRQTRRRNCAPPSIFARERECNSEARILGRMREASTKDPLAPWQRALPDDH